MSSLVTVIISCYNHAPYIEAAIDSVLNQTYPEIELLVIDDGSRDDSAKRIEALHKKHGFYFEAQQNKGLSQTLNEAIQKARGELIVIFGSDDIMLPERIAQQVAYMADKPEVGICGGNLLVIDETGNFYPDEKQKQQNISPDRLGFEDVFLQKKTVPSIVTQMFRKEALEKVGGFNPDIRLEDVYIWLKITHAGYYIDRMNTILSHYRVHSSNTYRNLRFMIFSLLSIYKDYASHPEYSEIRNKTLNSYFLKSSGRDKTLALELLKMLPVRAWNWKTIRGLKRYLSNRKIF